MVTGQLIRHSPVKSASAAYRLYFLPELLVLTCQLLNLLAKMILRVTAADGHGVRVEQTGGKPMRWNAGISTLRAVCSASCISK
jgi:hypothetical protein